MATGKVIGIGGIFLRATDPKGLQAWYHSHLGVPLSPQGYSAFEGPESQGTTTFQFFSEKSDYMGAPSQQVMINFRVNSLDSVLAHLESAGAKIDPHQEKASYGRFAWFWDPEGNRVELWEPPA